MTQDDNPPVDSISLVVGANLTLPPHSLVVVVVQWTLTFEDNKRVNFLQ